MKSYFLIVFPVCLSLTEGNYLLSFYTLPENNFVNLPEFSSQQDLEGIIDILMGSTPKKALLHNRCLILNPFKYVKKIVLVELESEYFDINRKFYRISDFNEVTFSDYLREKVLSNHQLQDYINEINFPRDVFVNASCLNDDENALKMTSDHSCSSNDFLAVLKEIVWEEFPGDILWIKLKGLEHIPSQLISHVVDSTLHDLSVILNNKYWQQNSLMLLTTPKIHSRNVRSLAEENNQTINLADDVSENFPVIFNLILWTCLPLSIAVLAISMEIINLDPGRDSLIYRMTSQKMKKEN